jgi:hypothetical protein
MILRSGIVLSNKPLIDNIQNDFVSLFYSIKSGHKYNDLINNPSIDTKYTISNLYIAFKTFYNKEYLLDPYSFLLYLSMNVLLQYKIMDKDQYCYICRENDSNYVLYCEKGHNVHIDCFYEKIVGEISDKFVIPNSPIRCDYCNSKFCINIS